MIIQNRNTLASEGWVPVTKLTTASAAAATTLEADNTGGFTNKWAIQIGGSGQETTEVRIGTAASGTSLTCPATSYAHPANTPIYGIKYDKVIFERSTAGTSGTASVIANGTVTYAADAPFTIFDDTSGSASYAYKTYFRNSVMAVNSTESDWITSSGLEFYSLGRIRQRIKDKLWDAGFIKNDSTVDEWVNEWREEMINGVMDVNEDYSLGTEAVAFGTDGLGTISAADLGQMRRVWVTYDGNNEYQSTKMNANDFFPDQVFSSVHPYHYWHSDNTICVKPSNTGTANITFYRFGTPMINDADTLAQPLKRFTKSFVNYGVAQALFKDKQLEAYDRIMTQVDRDRAKFVNSIVPRDLSGPTMIDVVENISGDDGWIP